MSQFTFIPASHAVLLLLAFALVVATIINYATSVRVSAASSELERWRGEVADSVDSALQQVSTLTLPETAPPVEDYLVTYCWIAADGRGGCRYGWELTGNPADWLIEKALDPEGGVYIPINFVPLSSANAHALAACPLPTKV